MSTVANVASPAPIPTVNPMDDACTFAPPDAFPSPVKRWTRQFWQNDWHGTRIFSLCLVKMYLAIHLLVA